MVSSAALCKCVLVPRTNLFSNRMGCSVYFNHQISVTVVGLCVQEAAELSSLKPQLDQLGVPLYAVVKEDIGTEVQNFRPYFKGEIFLDEKVDF